MALGSFRGMAGVAPVAVLQDVQVHPSKVTIAERGDPGHGASLLAQWKGAGQSAP